MEGKKLILELWCKLYSVYKSSEYICNIRVKVEGTAIKCY